MVESTQAKHLTFFDEVFSDINNYKEAKDQQLMSKLAKSIIKTLNSIGNILMILQKNKKAYYIFKYTDNILDNIIKNLGVYNKQKPQMAKKKYVTNLNMCRALYQKISFPADNHVNEVSQILKIIKSNIETKDQISPRLVCDRRYLKYLLLVKQSHFSRALFSLGQLNESLKLKFHKDYCLKSDIQLMLGYIFYKQNLFELSKQMYEMIFKGISSDNQFFYEKYDKYKFILVFLYDKLNLTSNLVEEIINYFGWISTSSDHYFRKKSNIRIILQIYNVYLARILSEQGIFSKIDPKSLNIIEKIKSFYD